MRRSPSSSAAPAAAPPATQPAWHKALAIAALVLMGAAMTVRPILGEMPTVQVNDLITPSPFWWNTSPAVMYLAHLIAATGLLLGVLWVVLRRQPWRFTGLEPAVLLLAIAAVISVPAASDKRLAINVAVGMILPIGVAAVLVQLLSGREAWRRALLAALLAGAAANCWRATRQQVWENEETWQHYQATKEEYWARQGRSLNDPAIEIFEARIKASQPIGYFYGANVLASFMLLGAAGAGAAITCAGWRPRRQSLDPRRWLGYGDSRFDPRGQPGDAAKTGPPAAKPGRPDRRRRNQPAPASRFWQRSVPWPAVTIPLLLALVAWQLKVIQWVGSAGAKVGIAAGVLAGLIVWTLRKRPWKAMLLCLGILVGLQAGLTVLAIKADTVIPAMVRHGGKLRSFAFRLNYWQGALHLFAGQPMTGVGPGQLGIAYPTVKPLGAAEEVAHSHNWLLNVAAEWGIVGLMGTVVALVLPAWLAVRRVRSRPGDGPVDIGDRAAGPDVRVLLTAWAMVFLCWLVFLPGVVPAGAAVFLIETSGSVPFAFAAAALPALTASMGPAGGVVLLAGLAAFFVHAAVEMSSGVAAAMWPFWAILALVVAQVQPQVVGAATVAGIRWWLRPALAAAAAGSLAVLVLTVAPMRSIWEMSQAKNEVASLRGAYAEGPLLKAVAADRIDPAPEAALGVFYQRMAQANPERGATYLRQAVEHARAAVQLDPRSHTRWSDLAWTLEALAQVTREPAAATQAAEAMRRAVAIYRNWPRGHMHLAGMLATAADLGGPRGNASWVARAVRRSDPAQCGVARGGSEQARREGPGRPAGPPPAGLEEPGGGIGEHAGDKVRMVRVRGSGFRNSRHGDKGQRQGTTEEEGRRRGVMAGNRGQVTGGGRQPPGCG